MVRWNQIRTLLKKPFLGFHIRRISLLYDGIWSGTHRRRLIYGSTSYNRWFLSRGMRRFLDMGMDRLSPHVPDSIEAWGQESIVPTVLLMCLAPNVESAEIFLRKAWNEDYLAHKLARGNLVPKPMFFKLSSLVLANADDREGYLRHQGRYIWSLGDLAIRSFLDLAPNLRALELRNLPRMTGEPTALPPQLTSLVMNHTYVPDLGDVIKQVPQLRRFCVYERPCHHQRPPAPAVLMLWHRWQGGLRTWTLSAAFLLLPVPTAAVNRAGRHGSGACLGSRLCEFSASTPRSWISLTATH